MGDTVGHEDNVIPASVNEVNAAWFTRVMKQRIGEICEVVIGDTKFDGEGNIGLLVPFDVKVKDCSEKGEKELHVIVKVKLDLCNIFVEIEPLQFYAREAFAYDKLLPAFKNIWKSANMEKDTEFYTESYLAAYDVNAKQGMVVLENLKCAGYELMSFSDGLTLEQLKAAVSVLAQHHVLSYMAISQMGDVMDSEEYSSFLNWVESTSLLSVWGMFLAEALRWFTNSHPEKIELESKLNLLAAQYPEILGKYLNCDNGGIRVICHGDYWCNNIMYRRNATEDRWDLKLIDFQCIAYGTPGQDLVTLILSSTTPDLRREKTDDILVYYHQCFEDTCAKLGLPKDTLSIDVLRKDYRSSLINGVLWCFISYQVFFESDETEDRLYWLLSDMADEGVI